MSNKGKRITNNYAGGDIFDLSHSKFNTGVDKSRNVQRVSDSSIENNFVATDHKALDELKQLVGLLQRQYPKANDVDAFTILGKEIARIKRDNPQQWQKFFSLKQLWNGLRKGALKAGEHFTEETPWGKAAIGFLEGVMDDSES
jgi:hypothetical protein